MQGGCWEYITQITFISFLLWTMRSMYICTYLWSWLQGYLAHDYIRIPILNDEIWYVLAAWVDRHSRTEYFVRGLSLRILFSRKILISYQYLQVVFNFADELMKWNEMGLCQKKCNNISCAIPLQCIEILSEGAH